MNYLIFEKKNRVLHLSEKEKIKKIKGKKSFVSKTTTLKKVLYQLDKKQQKSKLNRNVSFSVRIFIN